MGLVNHTITGLFNGVSQQPEELRLDTQAEEQINCYGTIVGGLRKRPPTELVFTNNTINTDSYIYSYNRGLSGSAAEKYLVAIESGKVRVFDINGVEKTVTGGTSNYLTVPGGIKAKQSFSCATVGDTTFIVNKNIVTSMDLTHASSLNTFYARKLSVTSALFTLGSVGTLTANVTVNGVVNTSTIAITNIFWFTTSVDRTVAATTALRGALKKFVGTYDYKVSAGVIESAQHLNITATLSYVGTGSMLSNSISVGPEIESDGDAWDETFFYWVKRTNPDVAYPANNYTYYIYDGGVGVASSTGSNAVTIASALAAQLVTAGYIATSKGSIVRIKGLPGITFKGSDSWGDQASVSWQGKIARMQELPNSLGFDGTIIQVIGDDKNAYTGSYLQYTGSVYEETVRPMLNNYFLNSTMPHALVRQADGTFTFDTIEYLPRKAGDYDTAPSPSFIDSTIQDVFFFKNRLGFISGSNVILSEVGEYYNFFPVTVTDILDSSPIDVSVDSNSVVNLSYAIPYNSNLLLFSDKAQFTVKGSEVLSPKTISANQSTSFEFNKGAAPVNIGPNVYFSVPTGSYSSIREYFIDAASVSNDAADVTAHVPTYLPANIVDIVGSSGMDIMFCLSSDTPNTVYVYKFYWSGDQKSQSAWSKWTFDGTVYNLEIMDNYLYILIKRDTTVAMERLKLELTPVTTTVCLDKGTIPYTAKYTLSRWRIKSQDASVDNSRGRLQVRTFSVAASPGSTYDMTVNNGPRVRTISNSGLTDNKALIMGLTDRVLVSVANSDITGKGFQINTASFEGNYTTRSQSL